VHKRGFSHDDPLDGNRRLSGRIPEAPAGKEQYLADSPVVPPDRYALPTRRGIGEALFEGKLAFSFRGFAAPFARDGCWRWFVERSVPTKARHQRNGIAAGAAELDQLDNRIGPVAHQDQSSLGNPSLYEPQPKADPIDNAFVGLAKFAAGLLG
jgi:hypothetical protein